MSSIKLIYRPSKMNEDGDIPLYIRVIKNRKTVMTSLGIYISPNLWDDKNKKVKSKHPNSARLNNAIAQKLAKAIDIALLLEAKDINVTVNKIKEMIKGKVSGSFTSYFNNHVDTLLSRNAIGTYKKAKTVFSKLNTFVKNKELQFEDIDVEFLKKYEGYLHKELGNSTNTIHGTIKVIRKLFNDATREGVITFDQNTFYKFPLKTEKTVRLFLEEDDLMKIEQVELEEGSALDKSRDIFVFACDAGGLRVSDLLSMKWENYNGSHINLVMKKTKDMLSVPLSNKALRILKKYINPDIKPTDYIFPFLKVNNGASAIEVYNDRSSANAYINKNLKSIELKAKLNKHISMHVSRHTYATRALNKGIGIEVVSKQMGHSDIKTTQIYGKIVNKTLTKEMEKFNENTD